MISHAPIAWGRLNAFQKVMLQWSSLHPYNATHTFKLAGPARPEAFREAVAEACLFHGVGISHLSEDGQSYRHQADLEPEVSVIDGRQQTEERLVEHLSRELNRPFERPTCRPMRFSLVDAGPQSHYAVLAYDHWIADSQAVRVVLRSALERYFGSATDPSERPLTLNPETYRTLFGRKLHGARLALAAVRTAGQWNRNRTAWQVAYWSNTHWAVDYRLYRTIPGTVARLRQFAHANGVTVHDVFLAAMGRALAQVMPSRGKSRGLALGSIVDTRGAAEEDLSNVFGAYLGYYLVRIRPDASAGLDEAARRVAALTGPIKSRQRYLDSLVNMKFVGTLWPWLSESIRPHFMRNALPMTGGISNVVVRDPWIDANRHQILEYSRGASTGPTLPIVLSPTTLGDQLNVGVTCRVAGFPTARIDALMGMFLEQIEHVNKASRGRPVGPTRQGHAPSPVLTPTDSPIAAAVV